MLQLNDLSLQPGQKIVPADQYQALLDARGIVQAAERQADRIVADARDEHQRQKQQGYNDGLMQGRMEIAQEMVDTVAESVDYFSRLEGRIVELVGKAVRKVIGEMDDRDRIVAVVRHALAVARSQSKATVRVCDDELETVQQRLNEIMRPYPNIQFIDVVADGRLPAGGCILETEIGVVNASVDVQLAAIEKSLAKSLLSGGSKS